jgi:glucokinase
MVVYGALDIGGTKIAGALVDPQGRLLVRSERPTPAREPAEVLMGAVTAVLDELSGHSAWRELARLGVASAGPVDRATGTVSPVNIPGWRGFPLIDRVRSHPRVPAHADPVLVGDAVAMAAAEHWLGAARGADNALCMVVSTGIGGGLVLDGRLHSGRTGNAGHIGHISVDLDGAVCPCGARGCVEGLASGTAIAARALAAGWTPPAGVPATAAGVAASARSGDPVARGVYDRAAQALAAAIAATAALVELDLVVIGGGVAQSGDTLFAPLRRHLAAYAVLDFVRGIRVVPAALALNAGLIGAAAVAAAPAAGSARARDMAAQASAAPGREGSAEAAAEPAQAGTRASVGGAVPGPGTPVPLRDGAALR